MSEFNLEIDHYHRLRNVKNKLIISSDTDFDIKIKIICALDADKGFYLFDIFIYYIGIMLEVYKERIKDINDETLYFEKNIEYLKLLIDNAEQHRKKIDHNQKTL